MKLDAYQLRDWPDRRKIRNSPVDRLSPASRSPIPSRAFSPTPSVFWQTGRHHEPGTTSYRIIHQQCATISSRKPFTCFPSTQSIVEKPTSSQLGSGTYQPITRSQATQPLSAYAKSWRKRPSVRSRLSVLYPIAATCHEPLSAVLIEESRSQG